MCLLKKISQNAELIYSFDKVITKITIENCYYYGIGISEDLSQTSVFKTAIRKLIVNNYSKCTPNNFPMLKIIQYALYELFEAWKTLGNTNMKLDSSIHNNPSRDACDGLPDSYLKRDIMYKAKRALLPRVELLPNRVSMIYKQLYKNFARKLRSAEKKFELKEKKLERLLQANQCSTVRSDNNNQTQSGQQNKNRRGNFRGSRGGSQAGPMNHFANRAQKRKDNNKQLNHAMKQNDVSEKFLIRVPT